MKRRRKRTKPKRHRLTIRIAPNDRINVAGVTFELKRKSGEWSVVIHAAARFGIDHQRAANLTPAGDLGNNPDS